MEEQLREQNKTIDNKNLSPSACLNCNYYSLARKFCTVFNYEIDLDTTKKACDNFKGSGVNYDAKLHFIDYGFGFFLALLLIPAILFLLSYFIPAIVTTIFLGLYMSFWLAAFIYGQVRVITGELSLERAASLPAYRLRLAIGQTMIILACLIHILFLYDIVTAGYLSWILLTGGAALSWRGNPIINSRELEAADAIEDIGEVTLLPHELTSGLEKEPLAIRITLPGKIHVGENIMMTLHVANNTSDGRDIELKYSAPCFEPVADSVPIQLPANTAKQVKYVVHATKKGNYVVKAQIQESQKTVTGKFKKISIKSPLNTLLKPVNVFRGVLGLASVSMTVILLIPDVIKIFTE